MSTDELELKLYSVFLIDQIIILDCQRQWKSERRFYEGDLRNVDLDIDSRFKEIKGNRRRAVFVGLTYSRYPVAGGAISFINTSKTKKDKI